MLRGLNSYECLQVALLLIHSPGGRTVLCVTQYESIQQIDYAWMYDVDIIPQSQASGWYGSSGECPPAGFKDRAPVTVLR